MTVKKIFLITTTTRILNKEAEQLGSKIYFLILKKLPLTRNGSIVNAYYNPEVAKKK